MGAQKSILKNMVFNHLFSCLPIGNLPLKILVVSMQTKIKFCRFLTFECAYIITFFRGQIKFWKRLYIEKKG